MDTVYARKLARARVPLHVCMSALPTKLVLDDSDLLSMVLFQNPVDESGLAGSKEPRNNSDRHLIFGLYGLCFLACCGVRHGCR